jgi:anti-sigma B factor antagonist
MRSNVPDRDLHRSYYGDPGAPIRIAVETLADGSPLVSVWGEVDLATAPHLERVLADASAGGDTDILVEFSGDSFIDSTGLNVLIQAARRLRAGGRALRVTTENPHTRSVIDTMGLTEMLGLGGPTAAASRPWHAPSRRVPGGNRSGERGGASG